MHSIVGHIYRKLPVWVQNIGISIYGYTWNRRRFGGIFKQELANYKQRESYSAHDWETYQEEQLRKLLVHASTQVPYYVDLFRNLGITTETLRHFSLNDLKTIPLLEKNTLRTLGTSDLIAKKTEPSGSFYASSGSTGTPTQILFSATMHQRWSAAFEARIRNWAGLSIRDARGMIGGRRIIPEADNTGPFYRYNSVEKQVYFSAYHISSKNVASYVEGMKKHHVQYMTGYAMSNYFLARFIKMNALKAPALKAVITSSEKLTPEMRSLFTEVYQCKTYDSYSGLEACGLISECSHGKLHISPDVGIIELIKEDGTCAQPGETGEAICTGFLNYDQPLIRYRIGDRITLSATQQCDCGRNMPVVDEIAGRVEDTVTAPDGRQMVRFHGIFINLPDIIEGQIIQHELKRFEIVVVCTGPLSNDYQTELTRRMESQLGPIELAITQTDVIPRNQNGKFMAVVSHLR